MDLVAAALEDRDLEFVLQFLDGDTESRLADVAAVSGLAEMAGLVERDYVAQLGERHGPLPFVNSIY
jgi:hypothetical protein